MTTLGPVSEWGDDDPDSAVNRESLFQRLAVSEKEWQEALDPPQDESADDG